MFRYMARTGVLLLALTGTAAAQFIVDLPNTPPFADADCGTLKCRPGGATVELAGPGSQTFKLTVPRSPYVTRDGAILIFPGETLHFDFPRAASTPGTPNFLGDGAISLAGAKNGVLTVTLSQQSMAGAPMMELNIRTTTDKTLKVDAVVNYLTPTGLVTQPSSTCPIMSQVEFGDDETWPQPIGAVLITNIRFVANNEMACE